jgi:hypothetical protein
VERADARSWEIKRCEGVVAFFQVMANKVEPVEAVLARSLLSKDRCRPALADEWNPRWPKVARIVGTFAFSRHAPRLAGAASGPDFPVVGPSGELEGVGPAPDAGEEVALGEASEVVGSNIDN